MFYNFLNRILIGFFTMFVISFALYVFIVAPGHNNLKINELDRLSQQLQQNDNINYYSGVKNYVFKSYYR